MESAKPTFSTERIRLPEVKGAYYQKTIPLRELVSFFKDHPAEDVVSLELMVDGDCNLVRIGMMDPQKMAYGTFARIGQVAHSIRGFYLSGSTLYLTGKNLPALILAYESRFDEVVAALAAARLRNNAAAKWISFHGVNNSSFVFDGLLWRSLIPCHWIKGDSTRIQPMDAKYAPSARIIGVMDNRAFGLGMEVQDEEDQDPESTVVRPTYQQRILFRETLNPHHSRPDWHDRFIERANTKVRGVGYMARVQTPPTPEHLRPRSGHMPAPDSIFTHVTYANGLVSTVRYSSGQATPGFNAPIPIKGWPVPPTVLAVVRPNPGKPAEGIIVQELQRDNSCLLHYLAPEQVPEPYLPYLDSYRP